MTFYTPSEIAGKLNYKVETVHEWLRTGKLEGYKLSRQWRVTDAGLRKFIGKHLIDSARGVK